MASGIDWTDLELQTAAEAYLWMLRQEREGKPFSKADVNKSLREGALSNRSKASIEYRMQNISAVLDEIGHSRIQGYVPAQNVGEGVKSRMRKALEARGFKPSSDSELTADETELNKRASRLRKRKIVTVPEGQARPKTVTITSTAFVRDPVVKAWVLQNASGLCEACGNAAPFIGDDGEPFLEVHHVRSLASGGSDKTSNAVAICPNCHRRLHHSAERAAFATGLYQRIARLLAEGISFEGQTS